MGTKKSDRDLAKEIYLKHKGEKPLVEIAEKIGRPPGTVRGWKSKDKWDDHIDGTLQGETERSSKKERPEPKAVEKQEERHRRVVKEVVANVDLTDKQQLFCIYYLKYFNATKAYQKAYQCAYNTAMVNGFNLLRNTKIKAQIEQLKAERMQGVYLEGKEILQKYIDIAFADITDFIEFGVEDMPIMDNSTGKQKIDENGDLEFYQRNYVRFKDDSEVDGTIISEISQGKDGVKLRLQDKMKALDFLAKNIGLLSQMDKAKIDTEKSRVKKLQAEIDKMSGDEAGEEVKTWVSAIEEIAAKRSGKDE